LIVKDMFAAIKKINAAGMTILLVEQNVAMAMAVSHRAYVLELGKVVAEGLPKELMARPEIQKAYLGL
jgi:branched-chain amino acid transport system ATP-binding protein